MRGFAAITTFLVFIASITAYTQDIHGSLYGKLLDSRDQPIQGANITLTGPNIQGLRGVASGQKGGFKLFAIPVGAYQVRIEHVSYTDMLIESSALVRVLTNLN